MYEILKFKILFIIFLIFFPLQSVYAYIDPGTGSYMIQLAIAGLLGGIFTLKMFWKKILLFFKELINKINGRS